MVTATLLVSCVKNITDNERFPSSGTLTAEFADVDFKESAQAGGGLFWNPLDSITVVSEGKAINFISDSNVASEKATFSNSSVKSLSSDAFAVYPANSEYEIEDNCVFLEVPSVQKVKPCVLSGPALVALSKIQDNKTVFTPACAMFGIKVKTEGVNKIRIQGYNEEVLSGMAKVGIDASGKPGIYEITKENTSIILYPEGGVFQPGVWYYFTVLPTVIKSALIFSLEKDGKFGQDMFVMEQYLFGGKYFEIGEVDTNITIGKSLIRPLEVRTTSTDFIFTLPVDGSYESYGHYELYANGQRLVNYIIPSDQGVDFVTAYNMTLDTDYNITCGGASCNIHTPEQNAPNNFNCSCKLMNVYSTSVEMRCRFVKDAEYYYTLDGTTPQKDNGQKIDEQYVDGYYKNITFSGLTPNTKYQFKIRAFDSSETDYDTLVLEFQTIAGITVPSLKVNVSSVTATSIQLDVKISGLTSYFLVYRGQGTEGQYKKYTSSCTVSFNSLNPLTEYYFTLVPFDDAGNAGKTVELCVKTAAVPYDNYFYYKGTYYEFTSGRTYTSRNQGNANWKYLRFNTSSSTTFVEFSYHVPYTSGIDSNWYDGTYKIKSSGGFYEYVGYFNTGYSSVTFAEGTLNINTVGGITKYTFNLEDTNGLELSGQLISK